MRILVGDKTLRFHPKSLEVHDGALLAGFWQSEKYFKPIENIIRKEFTLKNPLRTRAAEWVEKIKATKIPVSLHIRHGDYVTDPTTRAYHGICTIEYYEQAYQKMLELLGKNGGVSESDLGIFIFSDDIGWARENIRFGAPIHLVSSTDIAEYEEIVMMSKCSHHIIANSSFSWWGAWLNPSKEKIVVAPQRWNMDPRNDTSDVVPSEWVRI